MINSSAYLVAGRLGEIVLGREKFPEEHYAISIGEDAEEKSCE